CFNSNPTNGASIAMIWREVEGIAVPCAGLGRANDWDLLKTEAFKSCWPSGTNAKGDYWKNQAVFAWSDLNGDGRAQPDVVAIAGGQSGGITVMADLAFVASRLEGRARRFAAKRFTAQGTPIYELAGGETLVAGAQGPTSSGGDQAMAHESGWTILTVGPKPF